jgi:site-specific DNA-methyltransferase (adenine-specific)/modification methylase
MTLPPLLIEGDCLDVLPSLPAGAVDLVLCDLPYGTTQNPWDSVIPLDALWTHYRRILAPGGAIVLTAQGIFTARLILSQESWFKYKIAWVKSKPTNFLNARRQPLRKHEDICVFYASQPHYFPQMSPGEAYDKGVRKNQLTGSYGDFEPVRVRSDGERFPTDVVYFKTAEAEGPVWHPTQKPVELGRYLVRTYTAPGAVVLDHACGAGSFLLAAAVEGRRAIGVELNADARAFRGAPLDLVGVCEERLSGAGRTPTVLRRGSEHVAGKIHAFLGGMPAMEPGVDLDLAGA